MKVEVAVKMRAQLGEGPIWDQRIAALYWVDIEDGKLFRYWPERDLNETFDIGQPVGTVVPRSGDGVVLALQHGFAFYSCERQQLSLLANPEVGKPNNRFNDGKCDRRGRLVAGTMSFDMDEKAGALYRFDGEHGVTTLVDGLTIPNGMTWSADGRRFYFSDTPQRVVRVYDYDLDSGAISNRRAAFEIPEPMGVPDGMTLDSDGLLWVAHHGEGVVRRWDPQSGKPDVTISVPAANVTACWFGGADLHTLYITTASGGIDQKQLQSQPLAGSLLRVDLPQQGLATAYFNG